MDVRILDLDSGLLPQSVLLRRTQAAVLPLQSWGPNIRLFCRHSTFRRFQDHLSEVLGADIDTQASLTFVGSGDFHHVSLALLRRQTTPFNLLVLDNHPDWMRAVPLLHCGTWLYHASRMPAVQKVFHVGGDVDFDNSYRWLAPWPDLHSGKIVVLPARRTYQGRRWQKVPHEPLRRGAEEQEGRIDLEQWLEPHRSQLASYPLYISLDKDVMTAGECPVNWDSGHLAWSDVEEVLQAFLRAAEGSIVGMDVVGDWSPIRLRGVARRWLSWFEHPRLTIDADRASRQNEDVNLRLLACLAPFCVREPRHENFLPPEALPTSNGSSQATSP
jgi:hypothetical protein